jgi:hypothetical protein
MTDTITTTTQTPVELAAAAAAGEKKQYRYQPSYPEGHELAGQPMGGEQVIEYDGSADDLASKLVANNNRMQAEMRRMKVERGIDPQPDEEALPPGALSRKKEVFSRRDFTADERVKFAKGLANPATIQETFDEMTAARVGSNEEFKNLTAIQIQTAEASAGMRFGREHPEITNQPNDTVYTNPYGQKAIVPRDAALLLSWCDKRDLYHTYNNLVLAYDRLKKAGLLSEAPIAARKNPPNTPEDANSEPEADSSANAAQPQRRVATSSTLTDRNSQRAPAARASGRPTIGDIESLTAEQLKAKPVEWKKELASLIRRQTGTWVDKNLRPGSKMVNKLKAAGLVE